jgi:hypothetical protein
MKTKKIPKDVSEKFGESPHCKNLKVQTENGKSRRVARISALSVKS